MNAWDIYLDEERIDTIFFIETMTMEEVVTSLIEDDGYPTTITVKKAK